MAALCVGFPREIIGGGGGRGGGGGGRVLPSGRFLIFSPHVFLLLPAFFSQFPLLLLLFDKGPRLAVASPWEVEC